MNNHYKIQIVTKNDAEEIQNFVIKVIDTSYTPYYPKEALNFFKDYYSIQKIQNDIKSGYYIFIKLNDRIIATGLFKESYIGGVFIAAEKQGEGIGKIIMNRLERYAVLQNTKEILLDASIPAFEFYKKLGYIKISDKFIPVDNGKKLEYMEMKKLLSFN